MKRFEIVFIVTCAFVVHIYTIFIIPFVVINSLTLSNVTNNRVMRFQPITSNSRMVVIPCPDFLYVAMHFKLKCPNSEMKVRLPSSGFQNFALYDNNGRAVFTKNLLHEGSNFTVVSLSHSHSKHLSSSNKSGTFGSEFIASDANEEMAITIPVPVRSGVLLHRLLVDNRQDMERFISIQNEVEIVVEDPLEELNEINKEYFFTHFVNTITCFFKSRNSLFRLVSFIIFAVVVSGVLHHQLFKRDFVASHQNTMTFFGFELISTVLLSVTVGIISSIPVLIYLRSPLGMLAVPSSSVVTVGSWEITYSFSATKHNNPYVNLDLFLQGALGLPITDVVYATALLDSQHRFLHSDASYLVTAPTTNLNCDWWSITVYGQDKFLVPNEFDIYSVNSKWYVNRSNTSDDEINDKSKLKNDQQKIEIYLSSHKPSPTSAFAHLPWIPLPLPQKHILLDECGGMARDSSNSGATPSHCFLTDALRKKRREMGMFRLVLRAYVPDSSYWDKHNVHQASLPTITRLD